jgi:hypothetical protein
MRTEVVMAERKVAERALLVSEQRYQSLLASTNDYVRPGWNLAEQAGLGSG